MRSSIPRTLVWALASGGLLVLTLNSCSTTKSKPSSDEKPTEKKAQSDAEKPAELREHDDPGPVLERDRTDLEVAETEGPSLTADAIAQREGHLYIRAAGEEQESGGRIRPGSWLGGDLRGARLQGDRPGVVGFAGDPASPVLYLRLVGEKQPSERTVRMLRQPDDASEGNRLVWQNWTVTIPGDVETDEAIVDETRVAVARRFEARGRSARSAGGGAAEFYEYAAHRLRALQESEGGGGGGRAPDVWMEDTMTDLTGREAIDETLQADTTVAPTGESEDETVAIGELERLALPEHPWKEILDSLDADAPETEPVAALVPSDRIYARFRSLQEFIQLLDGAGSTLAPMLGSLSSAREADALIDRYERQLGIDASHFAEKFGDLAVEEVAVLLDDPYLPSGTATTIVFRTNTPEAVRAFLDGELDEATSELEAASETIERHGREIRRVRTDDRRLSHYRLEVDGAIAVSNSPAPLEAMAAIDAGDRKPLAEDPGFEFMRHSYAVDDDRTGFLYIGEDFVERFTGPEYRIAQARRSRARAELWSLHYGAMMHGWLEGRWPESPEALVESRYVADDMQTHSDGTTIQFDLEHGASSSWGRPRWMRPLSEIDVERVTPAEKAGYRGFVQAYQRLGHTYIDPIAVALDHGEEQTSFDVRVTPLHDRSEYRELTELVGDVHLYEGPNAPGLQWRFGIGEDSDLRAWTRRSANRMIRGREIVVDWLGSWGAVGVADRSGLWDAAILARLLPSRSGGSLRATQLTENQARALDRIPFWLALEVKSPMGFATFMSGVREFAEEAAPNLVSWKSAKPYREIDVTAIEISGPRGGAEFEAYYTVSDGIFLFSLDRTTLEHRLDALKAGYNPRPSPKYREQNEGTSDSTDTADDRESSSGGSDSTRSDGDRAGETEDGNPSGPQSAVVLRRSPDTSWLIRTLYGVIESGLTLRLPAISAARVGAERCWPDLDGEALRRRVESWWGVQVRNPHGRQLDVEDGAVDDPLYGFLPSNVAGPRRSQLLQNLPELPVDPSPITDWIRALQQVQFQISFERHAKALGLHARTEIDWRQSD